MKKYKVIIADDIPDVRLILSEMISDFCSECIEAENGDEAVDALKNNPDTDLLLTDIEMPEMNGFELTEYIRSEMPAPLCDIPIIAITSYESPEFMERCGKIGINDVLTKPYSAVQAIKILEKYGGR